MTDSASESVERRVLVLAPTEKDATLTRGALERAGIDCLCCASLDELQARLQDGAGVVLLPEEALVDGRERRLAGWLARQPPWSDLPVLILARSGADSAGVGEAMELLGNVTVLERPMRLAALVSAVRSALRARQRQYQIREHLVARREAQLTQARLAAIVASSDDAIISKSLDGKIQTWNAGAERLFGYTAEEAIGRPITLVIPPERLDEEVTLLERLRRGERIEHFDTVRVTKRGRRFDVSLTVSPVRDADGNVVGASKVARDITERKQIEAALRDADTRKDEFLAILAHELRNPLAPIRNALHLLQLTNQNDPDAQRIGAMMARQVDHMVRLVDDLMEVSRINRGKIELRRETIDLGTIVRSAVETSRPLIEGGLHNLWVSIPEEPLFIHGDPVRLAQVLSNLLNNAAKYTDPAGEIRLDVRRAGEWGEISVRDTGVGIASEMLPRVFDLFQQINRDSERSQGGLGIGLTLVKSLVELHGGTVVAQSAGPGNGSEFVVRLPVATTVPDVALPAGIKGSPIALERRRVLVVDDNRDAAESLGMLLEVLGAEVRVVYDGPAALEVLAGYQPSVALVDIGMPGMDGHEVARRIREQPQYRGLTLVALTGWGQVKDRHSSRSAGFDFHLVKPAHLEALRTVFDALESGGEQNGDGG